MCQENVHNLSLSVSNENDDAPQRTKQFSSFQTMKKSALKRLLHPMTRLIVLLVFSVCLSCFLLSTHPLPKKYTLYSNSLADLLFVSFLRLGFSLLALFASFHKGLPTNPFSPETEKSKGGRRTRDELEEASLEEPVLEYFARKVKHPSFFPSIVCLLTILWSTLRAGARLMHFIGTGEEKNVSWWITLAIAGALIPGLECEWLDGGCESVAKWGKEDRLCWCFFSRSGLTEALLPEEEYLEAPPEVPEVKEEKEYKSNVGDLLRICRPDLKYFLVAFMALLLAAASEVFLPKFTGNVLDALTDGMASFHENNIWELPNFTSNIRNLVLAGATCAVFSGLRGSMFTFLGGRVNGRLRRNLMDSLLAQEIGFFDVTKTGDLTSRLCSDTTSVGDQVTYNVNVFLRSFVQAVGVLILMFSMSWQLTLVASITIPLNTILAKKIRHHPKETCQDHAEKTGRQQQHQRGGNELHDHRSCFWRGGNRAPRV